MKMNWKCCWAVVVLSAGMALPARAQELVTNGSFEFGMGTTADNWTLTPTAAATTATSYPTATGVSPYGARFLSFNLASNTPAGSATQDIGGLDATTTYQLTFAYGAIGTTGTQTLQLSINVVGSSPIIAQTYTDTTPSLDLSTLWQRATYTFTGPAGLTPNGITFADTGINLTGDSDLLVDDVSLIAIPEPGTYALVGGGGLLLACGWLRRKRHAAGAGA